MKTEKMSHLHQSTLISPDRKNLRASVRRRSEPFMMISLAGWKSPHPTPYTTFTMADCSGEMVTTNTRARPEKPRASCICNMATAMTACNSVLTEADIPGASLCGRKPSELKNEELKFWLQCRNDPAKGLKTKAKLVKRWETGLFTLCFSLICPCSYFV